MTIDVVLDGPRPKLWPRVLRIVSRALGRVMLFVAALAVILLPPLGFIAASGIYKAEMPAAVMDHLALFFVGSLVIMVIGYRLGLTLVRRGREGVLFLRHFGHSEATRVVSAATAAVGGQWRFITLDDSSISPVSVMPMARRMARYLRPYRHTAPIWLTGLVVVFNVLIHAVDSADEQRMARVSDGEDLEAIVARLGSRVGLVFSPRLAVVTVAEQLWQRTVLAFAEGTSIALIDISQPSENLLWEVEQLAAMPHMHCIFVGQRDRLQEMVESAESSGPTTDLHTIVQRLDGSVQVLGYELDERGVSRFARALRATMEVSRA